MEGGKREGGRPSLAWWASFRKPPVMSAWPNIAVTLSFGDDDDEGGERDEEEEDGGLSSLLPPILLLLLLLHLIASIAASNSVLSLLYGSHKAS